MPDRLDPVTAVLFPGQGSHTPDMRDAVAERRPELLERCSALVGEDPFARVEESTRFAQPAIFCASVALWSAYDGEPPLAAAGHSLGELAALVAAGVLTEDAALELVVLRGRLMAGADDRGSMLALLGGSEEDSGAIAAAAGLTVANDNAPGQIVLSGDRDKLAEGRRIARERGVRAMELGVAGAFHSPSMQPAVEPFRAALEEVELARAALPRLLLRQRRALRRRPRGAGGRPAQAGPLARDHARAARRRRRHELRGDRPRPRAQPARQAHRPGARPCLTPPCRRWRCR